MRKLSSRTTPLTLAVLILAPIVLSIEAAYAEQCSGAEPASYGIAGIIGAAGVHKLATESAAAVTIQSQIQEAGSPARATPAAANLVLIDENGITGLARQVGDAEDVTITFEETASEARARLISHESSNLEAARTRHSSLLQSRDAAAIEITNARQGFIGALNEHLRGIQSEMANLPRRIALAQGEMMQAQAKATAAMTVNVQNGGSSLIGSPATWWHNTAVDEAAGEMGRFQARLAQATQSIGPITEELQRLSGEIAQPINAANGATYLAMDAQTMGQLYGDGYARQLKSLQEAIQFEESFPSELARAEEAVRSAESKSGVARDATREVAPEQVTRNFKGRGATAEMQAFLRERASLGGRIAQVEWLDRPTVVRISGLERQRDSMRSTHQLRGGALAALGVGMAALELVADPVSNLFRSIAGCPTRASVNSESREPRYNNPSSIYGNYRDTQPGSPQSSSAEPRYYREWPVRP